MDHAHAHEHPHQQSHQAREHSAAGVARSADCLTGKSATCLSSPFRKNISVFT
jgi:hypothetical protein